MGEVVKFRRPRKGTIRGAAREILTEALAANPGPEAVVIIVLSANGAFAVRSASYSDAIQDFDKYARAEAVLTREKMQLLD